MPNGFVSIPLINFVNADVKDDIQFTGCQYVLTTESNRRYVDSTFRDFQWIADFARDPLADAWQIPYAQFDNLTFPGVQDYADAYTCWKFENLDVPGDDTFNPDTLYESNTLGKIKIVVMFTKESRRLYYSKLFRSPLYHM